MNARPDLYRGAVPGAWYAVGVLTVAYMFSFIDRQILSLMVGPIRADLKISDFEFSLLHGFAFAIFYTFLGIPIGRLADATNRRNLIAIGVAFWSLATATCGLARQFWQLFAARVGVGIGEAALSPAAYSMLADMFHPRRLGKAIGIYSSGVFFGIGMSFVIGALVISALEARGGVDLPIIGHLAAWQATFMIVGLPGLLVAMMVMTLKEPARVGASDAMPVRTVVAYAARHGRVYALHFTGFSMITLLFNGIMGWGAEYFIRIHEVPRAEIGVRLGLITMAFGGSGIICGGLLSDWLAGRGYKDASITAALVGATCLVPIATLAPLVDDPDVSLILFAPLLFFSSFPFGPAAAGLQLITPPAMRAQMSAVYLFVINLTGIGFGPTAIALVNDFVFADEMKLHWSMSAVSLVAGVLGVALLALARRPFRDSVLELEAA